MPQQNWFILGLDVDNTCGDYDAGLRSVVADECGVDPRTLPAPTNWNYSGSWTCIRDYEHFRELHAIAVDQGLFRTMAPYPGLREGLWTLSHADVYIRVITHRLFVKGQHLRSATDTVTWFEDNDLPYRDLCFVGSKDHIMAHCYLEDAPHNIEALRAAGGYVVIYDQLYNRHLPGPRAHNWAEATDLILARKRELEEAGSTEPRVA